MSAHDDGGGAFPEVVTTYNGDADSREVSSEGGMSLRDYFAAKAMHAEIVTCGVPGEACEAMLDAMEPDETIEGHIAKTAYRMADAMLKARQV